MNTRRLVRRSARWVLVLWVISWAGAILNTCCDLRDDLMELHAEISQPFTGHQHDTANPQAVERQHPPGCCVSHSAPDNYISASVGLLKVFQASQPGTWVGVVVFLLAANGILCWRRPTCHGPPRTNSSLHLLISRLLI